MATSRDIEPGTRPGSRRAGRLAARAVPGVGAARAAPAAADRGATDPRNGVANPGDVVMAPPPTFEASEVRVDEHLGARLPEAARFRDLDGKSVTLGEVLRADKLPVILTFNYSDCPMLCSMQLNGLTATMPDVATPKGDELAMRPGVHYRIVTISLEPQDGPAKLTKMRDRYLARLPEALRADARAGWTVLAAERQGDPSQIKLVAETVGFKYVYAKTRAEWAHPSAFIFTSQTGIVTRYVYGFELPPAVLRESLIKAGMAEPAEAAGFAHLCYFYDPDASNHSRAGVMALRIGAAGFLVLLLSGLGVLHMVRRSRDSRRPHKELP